MHRHEGSPLHPLLIAREKRVDDLGPWVLTKRLRWSLLAVALIASGSVSLGVVGLVTPASASTPTSVTFNYTGSTQIFTVPADVVGPISFVITAGGGGGGAQDGGSATGGTGGDPAVVSGDLTSVLPGDSFTVVVGGGGGGGLEAYATSGVMVEGGWGDNGSGGSVSAPGDAGYGEVIFGGAGGGMSAIESDVSCPSGSSDYCAVAGGGGGGGAMSYSDDTGGAGGYGGSGGPDGAVGGVGSYTDYCVSEFRATATPGGAGGVQGAVSPGGAVSETVSDPPPNGTGGGGGGGAAGGAFGDGAEASGGTCYMGAGGGGGAASYVDTTDTTSSQVSEASSGGGAGGSSSSPSVGIAGAAGSVTLTYTLGVPPTITSTQSSTSFVVGSSVPYTFTATGTPTPAFSENGALPGGVSFIDNGNGTATLSGAPTQSGAYPITVTADNGESPNATESFTLDVDAAPTITSTQTAAAALDGQAMTQVSFAATGYPVPNFTEVGSLPGGVTLSTSGVLAGTPTQSGAFPLTVTASNGIGADVSTSFTLTVDASPQITSDATATFDAGELSTFTVTSSGYPTPTLALSSSSALPTGVTFTDNANGTATIAGTPITGGSYQLAITASSSAGAGAQTLDLIVDAVATFTSPTTIDIDAGSPVSFAVVTNGGYPTPTLSTSPGSLPPGLSFTDDTNGIATLSGTVEAAHEGSFTPTFTATEPGGISASLAATLVVQAPGATVVDCPPGDLCGSGGEAEAAPQITSANNTTCYTGSTCSFAVVATGSPPPNFAATGSLPSGVTLSAAGVLSGTPTTSGAYPITITAANGVTPDATQSFTLTVSAPPSGGGGGGGGGGTSPAPAPLTTPTTTTTTLPPSPTPTTTPAPNSTTGGGSTVQTPPPPVLTSYAVRATLSGTLRQTVTCSAAPTAIHESTAKGKLQALGLSLSCKAGKVKATLLVSIAAKIEVQKKTTKTHKIVKTTKTVWIGGIQLAEPARRLTLTLKPTSASVNNRSILTSTASGDIVQGHLRKAYTLHLTVTPKYST